MAENPDAEKDLRIKRLENEVRRLKSAVEELTVLNDLAISASTTLEVNQMLDLIVEKSIKTVKAEQGSILLVTEQTDSPLRTLIRQEDTSRRSTTYKIGPTFTGWVLKHQEPLLIEDVAADTRFRVTEQERRGIRSILCVPIRFKGELLGILTVANKKTLAPFNRDDLRLLSIIAAQSGQLIRNSQLQQETLQCKRMEDELEMAREIQLGLLPKRSPHIKGLEIANYFSPADEVSGDYYDYFVMGEDRIGIVMADVSGHGTSAALVMTMVKGMLHAITQRHTSTNGVISEINSTLAEIIPLDMFVTMKFLIFDGPNRLLRFSNAGHTPLLFCDVRSRSTQMLECEGPILGYSKEAVFLEREIPMHQDDIFLMYTDGVTETLNSSGDMFGEPRLIQAVQEKASEKAEWVVEHIKERIHEFKKDVPQSDDIAMVAVRIT